MFDLKEFLKVAIPTMVVLAPIIMALVTFWGKLGAKGLVQLLSSMATGLVLGGVVLYFETLPVDATGWFAVVLFGLLNGLLASGCYEVVKDASNKLELS